MLRYLLYFFLFYLLFRFVFGFLIPMFIAARRIRKDFRNMREHMEQQGMFNQQQSAPRSGQSATSANNAGAKPDDYIDFEEIK